MDSHGRVRKVKEYEVSVVNSGKLSKAFFIRILLGVLLSSGIQAKLAGHKTGWNENLIRCFYWWLTAKFIQMAAGLVRTVQGGCLQPQAYRTWPVFLPMSLSFMTNDTKVRDKGKQRLPLEGKRSITGVLKPKFVRVIIVKELFIILCSSLPPNLERKRQEWLFAPSLDQTLSRNPGGWLGRNSYLSGFFRCAKTSTTASGVSGKSQPSPALLLKLLGRKNFSSTLFGSRDLQIKLSKDRLTEEKTCNFYQHLHDGIRQKRSETQRSSLTQGLTCHFNKGKGVWTSRENNCEEATRKYMGELMEEKGYFRKLCLCTLSVLTFHLQW